MPDGITWTLKQKLLEMTKQLPKMKLLDISLTFACRHFILRTLVSSSASLMSAGNSF